MPIRSSLIPCPACERGTGGKVVSGSEVADRFRHGPRTGALGLNEEPVGVIGGIPSWVDYEPSYRYFLR